MSRALVDVRGALIESLARARVVPVVQIGSVTAAVELAGLLETAELPILEVTLRTETAAAAIEAVRSARPNVLIGAGTILDRRGLAAAIAAGAEFGVSPGFDPALSAAADRAGFAYVPGVATATEVQAAWAAGHRLLKFFPAEAAGGVSTIRALVGAFGHTGLSFIPTGGIAAQQVGAYLAQRGVAAVGGTWIAPADDIDAGAWDRIARRAAEARQLTGGR